MKIQDILFFVALLGLLMKNNPRFTTSAGLLCLLISIPLFATWVFFTAERLTWYAASFFLMAIVQTALALKGSE
jgi:hypothetical protein